MKYAFFDVDNTLYNGYTAAELIEFIHAIQPNPDLLKRYHDLAEDYRLRKISYNDISQIALDLTSEALTRISLPEARKIVTQMLQEKPKIFNDWVSDVIAFLKEQNYEIVLISAGPDLVIEEIAKLLGDVEWYATEIEHINDMYSGGKTHLLNEDRKSELIDFLLSSKKVESSIAFGDSTGDIPMLERADTAFVVQNDHHVEMMEYAKEKGWIVFEKPESVITLGLVKIRADFLPNF